MARRTQVYEYHKKHGSIVEYAGFDLPVWFEGIIPECHSVRNSCGMFDVSHMGRVLVEGKAPSHSSTSSRQMTCLSSPSEGGSILSSAILRVELWTISLSSESAAFDILSFTTPVTATRTGLGFSSTRREAM